MPSTQKTKTKKSHLVGTQCTIVLFDLIIDVQLLWIVLGYINPMSFECWKFRSGGFSGSGCPQPTGKMERNRRNRLLLGAFSDVPHEKNLLLTQKLPTMNVIPSHTLTLQWFNLFHSERPGKTTLIFQVKLRHSDIPCPSFPATERCG